MQAAVRSYTTMGVALVGASVVAVSPMAPPLPHVHLPAVNVSSVAVELSALSNPITQWAQLVQTALSNIGPLGQTVNANPAPILGQVVTNQVASAQVLAQVAQTFGEAFVGELGNTPGELQAAFQQIASGDVVGGVTSVYNAAAGPLLDALYSLYGTPIGDELTTVLQQPAANLSAAVNVLTTTNNLLPLLLTPLNIGQNLTDVVGPTAQALVDAVKQGDPAAFANALIGLAPALVGAIINGDPLTQASQGTGLLGPEGPLAAIQTLAQQVAKAITPATTAKSYVAKLPAASAKLVTLDAASPAKNVGTLALTKTAAPAAPAAIAAPTAAAAAGATKPSRLNPTKDVSGGNRKASKHVGDGSTDAAAGVGAKSSNTSTTDSKSSAGGSNGGGKHRAGK
jgi:hypothetical protein